MEAAAPRPEPAAEPRAVLALALGSIVGALLALAVFHGGGAGDGTMRVDGDRGRRRGTLVVLAALRGRLPVPSSSIATGWRRSSGLRASRSGRASRSAGRSPATPRGPGSTAASSTWRSSCSARLRLAEIRRPDARRSARRGDRRRTRLGAARRGDPVALRGRRPRRPPARAGRLLDRARAARRRGRGARPLAHRRSRLACGCRRPPRLRLGRRAAADPVARRAARRASSWSGWRLSLGRDRLDGSGRVAARGASRASRSAPGPSPGRALVDDGVGRAARGARRAAVRGSSRRSAALVVVALALAIPVERLVAEQRDSVVRALCVAAVAVALLGARRAGRSGREPGLLGHPRSTEASARTTPVGSRSSATTTGSPGGARRWKSPVTTLAGTGAGTFGIARLRVRDDATTGRRSRTACRSSCSPISASSGFALLALAVVGAAVSARRAVGRARGGERDAAVVLAIVALGYGLHALVDYDADFLAVTGPVLLVVGALIAVGRPHRALVAVECRRSWPRRRSRRRCVRRCCSRRWRHERSTTRIARSTPAISAAAASSARSARQLDPLGLEPIFAQADVAEAAGDAARARELCEEATAKQPREPGRLAPARAVPLRPAEPPDYCGAYKAFNEAYTLDPRSAAGGPAARSTWPETPSITAPASDRPLPPQER